MTARARVRIAALTLTLLGSSVCIAVLAHQPPRGAAPAEAIEPAELASPADAAVRFASLDVIIDTPEPLGAWQFEMSDGNGSMLIVGVENGDSPAFGDAPYFDLDAVQAGRAERIVVADFNALPGADLPNGATRVATVHVRYDAQIAPDYRLRLMAAGNAAGEPIDAAIRFATR